MISAIRRIVNETNTEVIDYVQKGRRVMELELGEIARLQARLDQRFGTAIELLLRCLQAGRKVIVCGVGKSGHIGEKIAATLNSTGCPAVVLNSLNALHGDLGVVCDGDVVLALSYSGETEELARILPALARLDLQIIALTGNPRSFLAQNAAVVLDTSVEQEACPLNLAPTSSTTAMLVLGDALAMVLLEARGFTKDDFARYHPGGQLGKTLLLKVEAIMRDRAHIPIVRPEDTVSHVLGEMTGLRAGAAVAVDGEGRLLGIYTHGDFVRDYQRNPAIGEIAVAEVLTRSAVTIRRDRLAAEALHVLETHRVDDLVVVDGENRPVGIVDSQDLARMRLV
jgi:arabinose-5-phosphate isomerase